MSAWDDFSSPVAPPKPDWDSFSEAVPQHSPEATKAYEETGAFGQSLPGRILVGTANEGLLTGMTIPALTAAKAVGIPGADTALESERHERDVVREAISIGNEQSGYASSVAQQAASGLGTVAFRAATPGGLMANTAVASGTENLHTSNSTSAAVAKTAIELAALRVGPLGKIGQEASGEIAGSLTANLAKGAATQTVVGAGQHAADYLVDVADGKHPYDGAELRSQLASQVPVNALMGLGGEAIHEIANRADATAAEIEKAKAATPPKEAPAELTQPKVEPVATEPPPPAPGMVRFYHGGNKYEGGSRWLTQDKAYAEGWISGRPNADVYYVDIPENHPILEGKKAFDDTGTSQKAGYIHFDAPEEIAKQLKPLPKAATAPPTEQPPPGGLDAEPTWLDETSPKHAFVDEDRELMALAELNRGDELTFKEALRQAREQRIPERAVDIAAVINTRPDKSATPVEVAGLTIRLAQLKNEYAEADAKADEATNSTDKAAYTVEAERLKAESDILHKAASGSPAGRRLSFQRLTIDRSLELLPVLRRAEAANPAEPLSEKEKNTFKAKVAKARKLQDEADTLTDEPLAEKKGLLGKVIEDIGAFHTNAAKNKPSEKTEIDEIALELQRLVQGAKTKPVRAKGKERPLTERERVVELQKRVDNLPEGTIDSFDKANIDRALDKLGSYFDSASKNKFLENVAKQKGRPLTPEEQAQFSKFYDELGDMGRKLASNKLTAERRKEVEYQQRRLAREVQEQINARKPKTLWGKMMEPFHFSRAMLAAFDLSAVLRQGGFVALGNPTDAARTFNSTLLGFLRGKSSAWTERGADALQQEIFSRNNAWMYDKGELFLHREDKLSNREEVFMSKMIEKVPGIGHAYKASERAYTAFLNRLRADTFDAMVATLTKGGEPTTVELKAIGNYINIATGRGNAYGHDDAMRAMTGLFFAPRYVLSRFQLAVGEPLWTGSARTRKLIATEYAKYALGMSLVYSVAGLAWGDKKDFKIGLSLDDLNTPDAGKIRIGRRTLIDPMSGLSQTFRMMWFTGKGTYSTLAGKEQPFGQNALDTASRFVRTKLAPAPQLVANMLSGKDAIGNPITLKDQTIGSVFPPLSMRDIQAAYKEEKAPTATALSALSLLGAGVQIYGPPDEINIVPGRDGISVLDSDGNPAAGPFDSSTKLREWLKSNGYRRNEQGKFEINDEAKQAAKALKERMATRTDLIKENRKKIWDATHGS